MNKYNIPSPDQVQSTDDLRFDALMTAIARHIIRSQFEFTPIHEWTLYFDRVKHELELVGWTIESKWSSQENGSNYWKITPKI